MKTLLIGTLLLSTTASFAQSIDLNTFKSLLTAKKATLEKVYAGMAKKQITNEKFGECGTMTTSVETIVKIDEKGMVIHSAEKFQSQNTPACRNQGMPASETTTALYYAEKPSLDTEISDLDPVGSMITSISKAGEIVTVNMSITNEDENGQTTVEPLLLQFDLTKPAFKYNVLNQGRTHNIKVQEAADTDLTKLDLKAIAFCESADQDVRTCPVNDWSDLLF